MFFGKRMWSTAGAAAVLVFQSPALAGHEVGDNPGGSYIYRCQVTHNTDPTPIGEVQLDADTVGTKSLPILDNGYFAECAIGEHTKLSSLACGFLVDLCGYPADPRCRAPVTSVVKAEVPLGSEFLVLEDSSQGGTYRIECHNVQ